MVPATQAPRRPQGVCPPAAPQQGIDRPKILVESESKYKKLAKTPLPNLDYISSDDERDVYYPDEDSFFLMDAIEMEFRDVARALTFVEIGPGSGVVSISVAQRHPSYHLVCVDINPKACEVTKRGFIYNSVDSSSYEVMQGNLVDTLEDYFADVIVFNPPYVPSERVPSLADDDLLSLALDGGVGGMEVIGRFLHDAKRVLKPSGCVYLLCTSLNDEGILHQCLCANGYSHEIICARKLQSEKLWCLRLWLEQ